MKTSIFLAVLISLVLSGQLSAQDKAKIEVLKFSWSMYDRNKITEEPDLFDTENVNRPGRREKKMSEKTIEEQSVDLRRNESNAKKGALVPSGNVFLYELQVKNLDEKNIASFIWEYSFLKDSVPQNSSGRRFLCVEKIKPGGSKTLRILSHLPPVNVVDAASADADTKKNSAVDVMINRVEYSDGTVWKKAGWDDSRYNLTSPLILEKLKSNSCAVL